jgi:hypothetical protein
MDIITGSRGHVQERSQYFRWAQQFFAYIFREYTFLKSAYGLTSELDIF